MDTPDWLDAEDTLCNEQVAALKALAADEVDREKHLSDELRRLLEERQAACDDALQQANVDAQINELERTRTAHRKARRIRELDPRSPYFGHLVLEEERRQREVLIGKGSAVDRQLPANIVDWRHAPISRLYYEYEPEDEYCEEIAGREREGLIVARRTLDIQGGVLQSADDGTVVARKRAGGAWDVRAKDEVLERSEVREDPEDHALPDIVALISPQQFSVLTRPDSGVVVLRGQAGSGKTTVALHRIAYLRYHDPERFRPDKVLVVMFNKALQTYIRKALADLDIAGVRVATFHGWASGVLRRAGFSTRFQGDVPDAVTRIKQHPAIEGLLRASVERLGSRLQAWLPVPDAHRTRWEQTEGTGLARLRTFLAGAEADGDPDLATLRHRVRARLQDHTRDLYALFDDPGFARAHLPQDLHRDLPAAAAHQARRASTGTLDFADVALLLRLGQLTEALGGDVDCPWRHTFAHIVVDEAQDLSAPAIQVLLDAADARRSVTLAGDPAQTLYDAGTFGLLDAGGSDALQTELELDTLPVGHRSTRPIMELALRASGHQDPELLRRTRPGLPVQWLTGEHATATRVAQAINTFRERRPNALVAVLCRTRQEADSWHASLHKAGLDAVRRGDRAGFTFQPGTVVSNVHQVKGLEFDGVVVVEPCRYSERDRNLLHVAITRAADQLWVVSRGPAGVLGPSPSASAD